MFVNQIVGSITSGPRAVFARYNTSIILRTAQKGWGHPQGDMHTVAASLSCQSAMVGTVWTNSCPGCIDRL